MPNSIDMKSQGLITLKRVFKMNQINKLANVLFISITTIVLFGCVPPRPIEPPKVVTPNFTFLPPSSVPSKSGMTIAIIQPQANGSMFNFEAISSNQNIIQSKVQIVNMLQTAKTDIEKILVEKGYHTLGPFDSIDEMTFSQKDSANLILAPVFDVNLDQVGGGIKQGLSYSTQEGTMTMHGSVSLALFEPLTREKVWIKRFDLEPYSEPYQTNVLEHYQEVRQGLNGQSSVNVGNIFLNNIKPRTADTQVSTTISILNHFYQMAMKKIWDHLDPREIDSLKTDAEKLKKRKQY